MNPESVLNVLMYLFLHHMRDNPDEKVTNETGLFDHLEEAGFEPTAIAQALHWLANLHSDDQEVPLPESPKAFRIFNDLEYELIDESCRRYLLELEGLGILNSVTRELVIHQILELSTEGIDLPLIKWVTLLVLFNQSNEQEALAHMELLVLDLPAGEIH